MAERRDRAISGRSGGAASVTGGVERADSPPAIGEMKLLQIAVFALAMQDSGKLSEQAQKLAVEKRYDEAEVLWRQAIDRSPDFFPALFNLGYMFYSNGKLDQAAIWLARAARVAPQDFNTRYLLGATLAKLEKREEALKEW